MSRVKAHLEERQLEEKEWHGAASGRMPKNKGRKNQPETQIEGQMELVPDKDGELEAKAKPVSAKTRETQLKWNKDAHAYYAAFTNMINMYGAYLQILRPWQDLKRNGLEKASSGSKGLLSDYYKDNMDKMTAAVYKRKDELFEAIRKFSKQAAHFKIDYPVAIDEELASSEVRVKWRRYIDTKVATLDIEAADLKNPDREFIPGKAITKVLTPDDMRTKYRYHKRKNK